MNKNLVIVILSVFCLGASVFGYLQMRRAEAAELRVLLNKQLAKEAEARVFAALTEAQRQRRMAEESARLAEIHTRHAFEAKSK